VNQDLLFFSIKNIILIILLYFLISTNSSYSFVKSNLCFKLVPFGYNGSYVQLPSKFVFCVKKGDKKIQYSTGSYGERLLNFNKKNNYINVFGDSHALGLDVNSKNDYFLSKFFTEKDFRIFAAPNNGPYEVLEFLDIHKNNFKDDNINIIFNISTDIFRLDYQWSPERFVAFNDTDLEDIKENPLLFRLKFYKNLIFNRKFTLALPDNQKMQKLFLDNYLSIDSNLSNYYKNLNDLKFNNINFMIILPYWIYEKKDQAYVENVNIFKKVQKLFCSKNQMLDKKFTAYMQKKDIDLNIEFLTFDKRHFKSNLVNLTSIDNLC